MADTRALVDRFRTDIYPHIARVGGGHCGLEDQPRLTPYAVEKLRRFSMEKREVRASSERISCDRVASHFFSALI